MTLQYKLRCKGVTAYGKEASVTAKRVSDCNRRGVGDLSDEVASAGQGKYFVEEDSTKPLAAVFTKANGLGSITKASIIPRKHKIEATINELA